MPLRLLNRTCASAGLHAFELPLAYLRGDKFNQPVFGCARGPPARAVQPESVGCARVLASTTRLPGAGATTWRASAGPPWRAAAPPAASLRTSLRCTSRRAASAPSCRCTSGALLRTVHAQPEGLGVLLPVGVCALQEGEELGAGDGLPMRCRRSMCVSASTLRAAKRGMVLAAGLWSTGATYSAGRRRPARLQQRRRRARLCRRPLAWPPHSP